MTKNGKVLYHTSVTHWDRHLPAIEHQLHMTF